jgi:MFS family permease
MKLEGGIQGAGQVLKIGVGGSQRGIFLPLVPFNAAVAAISTLVPLSILALGGSVIDVGFAAVAYSLALVPAPLIWGYVCDVTGSRRKVIILAVVILLASTVTMYISSSIASIVLAFAAIAHATGMVSPASNLLIIESLPKAEWDRGYAMLSWYSTLGTVLGLAAGMVWMLFFSLDTFLLACGVFAAASLAASIVMIRDPPLTIERRTILVNPQALVARLTQLPLLFERIPRPSDFISVVRLAREELTRDIPVIVLSSFLFSLSLNVFYTSYTPYLKANHLTDWEVFLTSLYVNGMNGVASRLVLGRLKGSVTPLIASGALAVRAIGMLLAAVLAIFVVGPATLYTTLLTYTLLGLAYTIISVNLNSLFYKALPAGRQGGLLGVYSASNGAALFLGSLASGYVSYYLGYSFTFFVGGILVFLSAAVLQAHFGGGPPPSDE